MFIRRLAFLSGLLVALPAFVAASDSGLKLGWTKQALEEHWQGCVDGIVEPARRDYFARAAQVGNSNPRPFPEKELRASAEPMCRCISRRLAGTYPFTQITQDPQLAMPFVQEAISGGECAPEGILGEVLKRQKRSSSP